MKELVTQSEAKAAETEGAGRFFTKGGKRGLATMKLRIIASVQGEPYC